MQQPKQAVHWPAGAKGSPPPRQLTHTAQVTEEASLVYCMVQAQTPCSHKVGFVSSHGVCGNTLPHGPFCPCCRREVSLTTQAHTHTLSGPHCQGTPTRVLVGALHLALGAAPPLPTGPPAHTLQRRHYNRPISSCCYPQCHCVKHYVVLGRLECYITGKVMVSVTSEKAVIVDSVEHQAPRRHKGLITSPSFNLH